MDKEYQRMYGENNLRNKKCLLIMPALYIGGAEKQYRYIINELSKLSDDIVVVLLNNPLKSAVENTNRFIKEHRNVTFIQLKGNAIEIKGMSRRRVRNRKIISLIRLYCWLRQYLKYEAVGTVMFSYVTQLLMTPLFYRYGTKVIFNERNTGRQICDKKYKINLLRKCYKVIANSSYAAKYIMEKTGITVDVFHNGIESKQIKKTTHEGINVLVPARITPVKNQMLLVEVSKYLTDLPIKFILAGTVEDQDYGEKLIKRIAELRVSGMFELSGYIDEMEDIYRKTDIVVLPSLEEGTPNVLLEAYTFEIMALASDIPMNRDCCTHKDTIFDPGNARDLADKIRQAASNLNGCIDIIKDNKKYVACNYSLDKLRIRYSELLLGDIIGRH